MFSNSSKTLLQKYQSRPIKTTTPLRSRNLRSKSPELTQKSISPRTTSKKRTQTYAELYKKAHKNTNSIMEIHNPFSKKTTSLSIRKEINFENQNIAPSKPAIFTANLDENSEMNTQNTQEIISPSFKNESDEKMFKIRSVQWFDNKNVDKNEEKTENEIASQTGSSCENFENFEKTSPDPKIILNQLKSDKKVLNSSKALEKLTDVNVLLAEQMRAMQKELERMQFLQAEKDADRLEASLSTDRRRNLVYFLMKINSKIVCNKFNTKAKKSNNFK